MKCKVITSTTKAIENEILRFMALDNVKDIVTVTSSIENGSITVVIFYK